MRAARLLLPIVVLGCASAQDLLTESSCSGLSVPLSAPESTSPLEFSVRLIRPQLNYAFRFQAGYSIDIPFRQFVGTGNSIRVVARVVPNDGSRTPVCFVQVKELAAVPPGAKEEFELAGGFLLGEGSYRIELTVSDQRGRLSRRGLNITAARKRRERRVRLGLEPGSIQTIYRLAWKPRPSPATGESRRLTVFFHAASLYGPRTLLRLYDVTLLLSSLSTVLSEVSFDDVRLIAFNLDQQEVLFRRDRFGAGDLRRLAETLLSVNLATIPVEALAQTQEHLAWVETLVRDELSASRHPAAIVFLGPYARDETKWKSLPCEPDRAGPRLFYFQHRIDVALERCGGWPYVDSSVCPTLSHEMSLPVRPTEFPDTLERLVRGCWGEVYRIHNPLELAAAIKSLNSHVQ